MKEYKIIKQEFSWTNSQKNFEDQLNNFAKQGWRVINVLERNSILLAVLEKDKNR